MPVKDSGASMVYAGQANPPGELDCVMRTEI